MCKKVDHMNIILEFLVLAFMIWFVFLILFKLLNIIAYIINKKKLIWGFSIFHWIPLFSIIFDKTVCFARKTCLEKFKTNLMQFYVIFTLWKNY